MDDMLAYLISVVAIPAVLAGALAAPFTVGPWRRHPRAVEAGLASAVLLAFLVSFLNELDWRAVVRQVCTIEGDSAPIERWHRLGLVAALLIPTACLFTLWTKRFRQARRTLSAGAVAVLAACLAGWFVRFPGTSFGVQVGQGALVLACFGAWSLAAGALFWTAWVVLGVFAVLAGLGGFASLAVMCGAMSAAAFLIGALRAVGIRLLGAVARESVGGDAVESADRHVAASAITLVLAVMTALIARCAMAYDTLGVSPSFWTAAALIPLATSLFRDRSRAAARPAAKTFWTWLGVALAGVLLLSMVLAVQAWRGSGNGTEADDATSGMYGS